MAEPNLFAYGAHDDDPHAIQITVSNEELEAFQALPRGPSEESVEVVDIPTGMSFEVRRASCGAGCYCAAKAELVSFA